MAAQKEWAWDLEEMRSAGAMLDEIHPAYTAEYVT
jgi:hypothetical protein